MRRETGNSHHATLPTTGKAPERTEIQNITTLESNWESRFEFQKSASGLSLCTLRTHYLVGIRAELCYVTLCDCETTLQQEYLPANACFQKQGIKSCREKLLIKTSCDLSQPGTSDRSVWGVKKAASVCQHLFHPEWVRVSLRLQIRARW